MRKVTLSLIIAFVLSAAFTFSVSAHSTYSQVTQPNTSRPQNMTPQPPRPSPYPLYTLNATSLSSVSKCSVKIITLNAMNPPTISCQTSTSSVTPNISITSCANRNTTSVEISADQGVLCFAGTGYIAFHGTHAQDFWSGGATGAGPKYNGWMKMYPSGTQNAYYFSYAAGQTVTGSIPFNSKYDFTQLCNNC